MPTAPHRVLLVRDHLRTDDRPRADDPRVRRYRFARLRVAESRRPRDARHAHLARTYD